MVLQIHRSIRSDRLTLDLNAVAVFVLFASYRLFRNNQYCNHSDDNPDERYAKHVEIKDRNAALPL